MLRTTQKGSRRAKAKLNPDLHIPGSVLCFLCLPVRLPAIVGVASGGQGKSLGGRRELRKAPRGLQGRRGGMRVRQRAGQLPRPGWESLAGDILFGVFKPPPFVPNKVHSGHTLVMAFLGNVSGARQMAQAGKEGKALSWNQGQILEPDYGI